MTDSPKYPRGRPPKSKNVLLKSTMEPVKEQPPVVPTIPEVKEEPKVEVKPEVVEVKSIEVKEKKPRTEQQLLATKRMIEANKAKRKINIVESKPEPKSEPKPEPKPEPTLVREAVPSLEDKLRQMEEKLAMMEQRKQKKKKSEPAPKPVKEPKPKKMQRVESSSESESEESDDDEYVEKYKQKAERRFQAVQAIEKRLQQAKAKPKGKYDHLSLF